MLTLAWCAASTPEYVLLSQPHTGPAGPTPPLMGKHVPLPVQTPLSSQYWVAGQSLLVVQGEGAPASPCGHPLPQFGWSQANGMKPLSDVGSRHKSGGPGDIH